MNLPVARIQPGGADPPQHGRLAETSIGWPHRLPPFPVDHAVVERGTINLERDQLTTDEKQVCVQLPRKWRAACLPPTNVNVQTLV